MFSGIIKEIGTVRSVKRGRSALSLSIESPGLCGGSKTGDSVSVDGVCLTVTGISGGLLHFDAINRTLMKTTLAEIKEKAAVNLEPSLKLNEGISGHLVSGHVDGIGTIRKIFPQGSEIIKVTVDIDPGATRFLVIKGSVAVDGISLTVNDIGRRSFGVDIIPHTYRATAIHLKRPGGRVNVEFDLLGKYALKSSSAGRSGSISESFLTEHGYF